MKYLCCILFALLLLTSCSDDPAGPTQISLSDFNAIMTEAGKVVPPEEERDDVTTEVEEEDGVRYTYEMHDAVENMESVVYLGMNDDIVWPGNLVKGELAQQYVYEPITAPRAPITLSISLETSGVDGSLSEVVENPSLSTVRQGISDLTTRILDEQVSVPAQVDWTYEQVYSSSQMSLFVGADISYGLGSLSTTFNWDESSTTTKIMAKYTQVYFSIDMDTPSDPRNLFADDITPEQLRSAMPAGSRPLYVASVKYGMMAIMCIETEYTTSQMGLALDAAYNGVVDVDIEFGLTARDVLDSSSIRIIVYGGSTSGIEELNDLDGLMSIISASTEFTVDSPGVPLLYKFRHIHDNTLALISLTSQYTIVRPLQIEQWVRLTSMNFICEMSSDDDPFYDDDVDMDRFNIYANAFNRVDGFDDPGTQINPVDEVVFAWSTPDYYEMHGGSIFEAPGSIDVIYNTEDFGWEFAHLQVKAYARDYDWASGNESAWGTINLYGDQMWGVHDVMLYNSDFTFRLQVRVDPLN